MSQSQPSAVQSKRETSEPARKFWELWQRSPPPDVRQFVEGLAALKPGQLAPILCVDLRERWRRHDRVQAEEYLRLFPKLQEDREAALDVVYCEFLIRDELGESPGKAEYANRFPNLGIDLSRQIEMHRLLQADVEESDDNKVTLADTAFQAQERSREEASWPTLPGFEILGRLGRGGMGVVYKAWQDRLYRLVAIKMLQAGGANDQAALSRFRSEGEAIARLQHANIVQIYDVGEHDGRPYLIMEFAEGGSLAQKLDGTPWPAQKSAELVETLARAIHYAHQRGVVHRDLTPGNVLLFADGTPKLSDFGLAKLLVGGHALTQTGDVVGTPSYMSPEQASGSVSEMGPGIDVYSLGAILFELLTGRPPFKGATTLETLAQVLRADPVSPRQLQPGVPRDLETICLKCLRKEPGRRYQSAQDLGDDLKHFLKNEPIEARPVGQLERVWRWSRREPGWAMALVMVIVTAIGAVAAASLLGRGLADSRRAHARTKQAHEMTKEAEVETLRKLYRATVNEARAKRRSGFPGQRTVSLAALADAKKLAEQLQLPRADLDELRNEAVASLAIPDMEVLKEWPGFPPGSFGLDFDETLQFYARSDINGAISLRRIDSDKEIAKFESGTGKPMLVRISPEARGLAAFSANDLFLWRFDPLWILEGDDPVATKQIVHLSLTPGDRTGARFSMGMKDQQMAVIDGDGATVLVHDSRSGAELYRGKPAETLWKVAFHPNQEILALAGGNEALLFDLKTRTMAMKISHPEKVLSLTWGQHGRYLVTACEDKFVRVWEVGSARFAKAGFGPIGMMADFDVKLMSGPPRLANRFLVPSSSLGMDMAVNFDASLLGTTSTYGTLRLWDMKGGQQLVMPISDGGRFRFHGMNEQLACSAAGGKARLVRTILGREFRRLPAFDRYPAASSRNVAFHALGRFLVASGAQGLNVLNTFTAGSAPLSMGHWMAPVGFEETGALVTESATGYQRWPAAPDPNRKGLIRLGPPTLLATGGNALRANLGVRAKILVIPEKDQGARAVFLDEVPAGGSANEIRLEPQKDVRYGAASPDGRWIVTGTHDAPGQPGAMIWEAKTGKKVVDIPVLPRFCDVDFSPDGRWLITSGGGCRLWEVGTWKEGPILGGAAFAFSPDGKLLAVECGEGQIRLLDPATAKEFVRLTAHGELLSLPCCFSQDNGQLVVYGTESQALHVWDLRAVRAQLTAMGLDWDAPPISGAFFPFGPGRLELVKE